VDIHLFQPAYISLYLSGELRKRAETLEARLTRCDLCPRNCGVNRLVGEIGFCRSGAQPIVASVCAHHGEEPPLSGTKGSGTIFFGNCTMRCVYCQNHQISQDPRKMRSHEIGVTALSHEMLRVQNELGCHNINLVSPSHFVPQIVRALCEAVPLGLHLPLVYNTSGYDSIETLKLLDGIIDNYLPDIRYASKTAAEKYSRTPDYVGNARAAIKEMHRQVGGLILDDDGIARRGLIVRHLILPGGLAGSEESLAWLAENVSRGVHVSIMAQYYPAHRAARFPELARRITPAEYEDVLAVMDRLGMENGWIQELDSPDSYQPDFGREGHPFQRAPAA
jgi:putative pyruvate formate lyase activating enzyme